MLYNFIKFTTKGIIPSKKGRIIPTVLKLFVFLYLSQIILFVPIFFLKKLELVTDTIHPIQTFLENANTSYDKLNAILIVGVIYPIIEELTFRYPLFLKKKQQFNIALALIFSYIITWSFNIFEYIEIDLDLGWYSFAIQYITITFMLIPVIKRTLKYVNLVNAIEFIDDNSRWFIFISSTLFTLVHLLVSDTTEYVVFYLIILLPYFFSGYFYSFVRCWYGIRYSVILHSAFNLTLFFTKLFID